MDGNGTVTPENSEAKKKHHTKEIKVLIGHRTLKILDDVDAAHETRSESNLDEGKRSPAANGKEHRSKDIVDSRTSTEGLTKERNAKTKTAN